MRLCEIYTIIAQQDKGTKQIWEQIHTHTHTGTPDLRQKCPCWAISLRHMMLGVPGVEAGPYLTPYLLGGSSPEWAHPLLRLSLAPSHSLRVLRKLRSPPKHSVLNLYSKRKHTYIRVRKEQRTDLPYQRKQKEWLNSTIVRIKWTPVEAG